MSSNGRGKKKVTSSKAGLSVQELKAMTAMRLSQAPDQVSSIIQPKEIPQVQPSNRSRRQGHQRVISGLRSDLLGVDTQPPHSTSKSSKSRAGSGAHSLTVQDIKELTKMRLARENFEIYGATAAGDFDSDSFSLPRSGSTSPSIDSAVSLSDSPALQPNLWMTNSKLENSRPEPIISPLKTGLDFDVISASQVFGGRSGSGLKSGGLPKSLVSSCSQSSSSGASVDSASVSKSAPDEEEGYYQLEDESRDPRTMLLGTNPNLLTAIDQLNHSAAAKKSGSSGFTGGGASGTAFSRLSINPSLLASRPQQSSASASTMDSLMSMMSASASLSLAAVGAMEGSAVPAREGRGLGTAFAIDDALNFSSHAGLVPPRPTGLAFLDSPVTTVLRKQAQLTSPSILAASPLMPTTLGADQSLYPPPPPPGFAPSSNKPSPINTSSCFVEPVIVPPLLSSSALSTSSSGIPLDGFTGMGAIFNSSNGYGYPYNYNSSAVGSRSRTSSNSSNPDSPPGSPKTMRHKSLARLSIQCPGPVRIRSMSDSNSIALEMAESVFEESPTGTPATTPRRLSFRRPSVESAVAALAAPMGPTSPSGSEVPSLPFASLYPNRSTAPPHGYGGFAAMGMGIKSISEDSDDLLFFSSAAMGGSVGAGGGWHGMDSNVTDGSGSASFGSQSLPPSALQSPARS